MTDLEIFQALRPIIMTVTQVDECILGDPNEIAPAGLYAAVRVTQSANIRGAAQHNRVVDTQAQTVTDTLKKQMNASLSVSFYRAGALDAAKRLVGCNYRSDVSSQLFQAGIGWRGTQAINNLSGLLAGDVEERSQVTIDLMYQAIDTVTYNTIEQVKVIAEDEQARELVEIDVSL